MEPYAMLEREFAAWNMLDPAGMVACSSGTAALHLALESLEMPKGSEVLVPDFTMVACPRAVELAGMKPVFVDCNANDLTIDVDSVYQKSADGRNDYAAAMFVHIYGRKQVIPDTFPAWWQIEDLAEAHGIRPDPKTHVACWSFYKNKVVAGEEGGAVWFRNPEHAELARGLRSLGFTPLHDFNHIPRGHNYRLANSLAELIRHSLRCAPANIIARRAIEAMYESECPAEWRMPYRDVPWVYDIRIPGMGKKTQDAVIDALSQIGIAARHGFKPMTGQAEWKQTGPLNPNALLASREVIYFPIQPGVTTLSAIRRGFQTVRGVLAGANG